MLGAQSRAALQVAAQVISAGPSLEALALVVPALNQTTSETGSTLATVQVDRDSTAFTTDTVALKPRAVVTIAFLSN